MPSQVTSLRGKQIQVHFYNKSCPFQKIKKDLLVMKDKIRMRNTASIVIGLAIPVDYLTLTKKFKALKQKLINLKLQKNYFFSRQETKAILINL